MRIRELLTESETLSEMSRPDLREAEQKLFAAGYEKIGTGTWGDVYSKPGDSLVLKLFHPGDQAYTDFVTLALQHQNNPHFPKFHGKMMKVTDDYNAVRMEKLTPNTSKELAEVLEDYLNVLSGAGQYVSKTKLWPLLLKNPKLKEACKIIAEKILKTHYLDLQPQNIMMRGNTVVFTDPVS
jgi:hypothetical protein